MANFQNVIKKTEQAIRYLQNDAKTIIGVEAVNFYKESFENQGFTDTSLKKWEDVKRRDLESPWRGFQYGATVPRPKQKRHKKNAMTNYSPAAEQRPILSGQTQELMNGIRWERTAQGVRVYAEAVYAKIHNEGGEMSIFGKKRTTMPQRQFMGKSQKLTEKITEIIKKDLQKIFK